MMPKSTNPIADLLKLYPEIEPEKIRVGDTVLLKVIQNSLAQMTVADIHKRGNYTMVLFDENSNDLVVHLQNSQVHLVHRHKKPLPTEAGTVLLSAELNDGTLVGPLIRANNNWVTVTNGLCRSIESASIRDFTLGEVIEMDQS